MQKNKCSCAEQDKSKIFKTYNEAMEKLLPRVWEDEKREKRKDKKEADVMKELAGSILSRS